jgi:excisionase family DNA binding protein
MKKTHADMLSLLLKHLHETNTMIEQIITIIQNDAESQKQGVAIGQNTVIEKETEIKPVKEIMTLKEAAEYMGKTKSALYRLIHDDKIACYKPSRNNTYLKKEDVDNYMLQNRRMTSKERMEKATEILNTIDRERSSKRRCATALRSQK